MMIKKYFSAKYIGIIIFILIFANSCSTLNTKEVENLKDKKFYLQNFKYSEKGINKKTAFEIIEKFPTDRILQIISHKYSIIIDSSDFEEFIISENSPMLKTKGMLFDIAYIWENSNKHDNIIEIEYINYFSDSYKTDTDKEFVISVKAGGKTVDTFMGKIIDKIPALISIAKSMDYARVDEKNDDLYLNKITKGTVSLISSNLKEKKKIAKKNSKEKIIQDIKNYLESISPDEKKKFRDEIIKFLYTTVE